MFQKHLRDKCDGDGEGKGRVVTWAREDSEVLTLEESQCVRDEQEIAELEILFVGAGLSRDQESEEQNEEDTEDWKTVHRSVTERYTSSPNFGEEV